MLGGLAAYASVRDESPLIALLWLVILSPILLNAHRTSKNSTTGQPAVFRAQDLRANVAESISSTLSKFFKTLAVFFLGLAVLLIPLFYFWELSGYATGYAFAGALGSYALAKAFE